MLTIGVGDENEAKSFGDGERLQGRDLVLRIKWRNAVGFNGDRLSNSAKAIIPGADLISFNLFFQFDDCIGV